MTDGRSWRNRTPGLGTSASFPKLPVLSACRHPRGDETEYAADRWARFIHLLKRQVCDARAVPSPPAPVTRP